MVDPTAQIIPPLISLLFAPRSLCGICAVLSSPSSLCLARSGGGFWGGKPAIEIEFSAKIEVLCVFVVLIDRIVSGSDRFLSLIEGLGGDFHDLGVS